jgi:ABC-2 type transport system ATP-binding protein
MRWATRAGHRGVPARPDQSPVRGKVLLLDEPVASLDPLARREFLQTLMEVVALQGVSVVLSSHLIADLERVWDYLVVLVAGHVAVSGAVDELTNLDVIEARHMDKQSTLLVRTDDPIRDPTWTVIPVTLDDLVLAYMRQARDGAVPSSTGLAVAR